jgi:hypothetical protein
LLIVKEDLIVNIGRRRLLMATNYVYTNLLGLIVHSVVARGLFPTRNSVLLGKCYRSLSLPLLATYKNKMIDLCPPNSTIIIKKQDACMR